MGAGVFENYKSGHLGNSNPINLYQNVPETLLIPASETHLKQGGSEHCVLDAYTASTMGN